MEFKEATSCCPFYNQSRVYCWILCRMSSSLAARYFGKFEHKQNNPTILFCDSNSTIYVAKDPVLHGKTKHIRMRYHFLRELVHGVIEVEYVLQDR